MVRRVVALLREISCLDILLPRRVREAECSNDSTLCWNLLEVQRTTNPSALSSVECQPQDLICRVGLGCPGLTLDAMASSERLCMRLLSGDLVYGGLRPCSLAKLRDDVAAVMGCSARERIFCSGDAVLDSIQDADKCIAVVRDKVMGCLPEFLKYASGKLRASLASSRTSPTLAGCRGGKRLRSSACVPRAPG